MGALAEFERSLIVERTQAGLQAARKRGARIGRPLSLSGAQIKHAAETDRRRRASSHGRAIARRQSVNALSGT